MVRSRKATPVRSRPTDETFFPSSPDPDRLQVAVLYPGPFREGWPSLALHGLLKQINAHPHAAAEPVFARSGGAPPVGWVTGRALAQFQLLAVTLSFEQQWVLLPYLLRSAGLPARSAERDSRHPIVLAGGVACRLNPRPGLPFIDVLVPGDSEPRLADLLTAIYEGRGSHRARLLDALNAEGVLAQPFGNRRVRAVFADGGPPVSQACRHADSLFGRLVLVETGRGCPAGCRFCALGFSRRPPVFFSAESIVESVRQAVERGERIGLVGASLGQHPELVELVGSLAQGGADLSPASLDPGVLVSTAGPHLLSSLSRGAQRSVTLAPEAGSVRLRRAINKPFEDEVLTEAVRRLGESGVIHLKLYLMYGLPSEGEDDLEAAVELVSRIRRHWLAAHRPRGGTGRLSVSLNPFVPKPHTPFERAPMPALRELRSHRDRLAKRMRRLGGVSVSGYSPRHAILQCLLDRADESLAGLLEACEGRWPPPADMLHQQVPDLARRVHQPLDATPTLPWHMVDVGLDPASLEREAERAGQAKITPACIAERCGACRACAGLAMPLNQ